MALWAPFITMLIKVGGVALALQWAMQKLKEVAR